MARGVFDQFWFLDNPQVALAASKAIPVVPLKCPLAGIAILTATAGVGARGQLAGGELDNVAVDEVGHPEIPFSSNASATGTFIALPVRTTLGDGVPLAPNPAAGNSRMVSDWNVATQRFPCGSKAMPVSRNAPAPITVAATPTYRRRLRGG